MPINMVENASNPSVPPAGSMTLFAKTDNHFYTIDSLGNVTELGIIAIGNAISGATPCYALYVDSLGNLAESSTLPDASGLVSVDQFNHKLFTYNSFFTLNVPVVDWGNTELIDANNAL